MPSITFILLTISLILTTGFCDDKQSISVRNSPFHDESDENLESAKIDACMSNELELRERENCRFFAIMIDAGSTGTRISINEFQHETNFTCAGAFKLENETHVEVKPGLSSFADQPEKAAEKINQLLSVAVETVPANLQKHTPIALRATAGLRLLPGEKADEILRQARLALLKSPFLISDDIDDSVSILSGTDEGIFGWFTLNFLLDRLKAVLHDPNELVLAVRERWTAGALDLGGGSTQITYRPLQSKSITNSPENHLHTVTIFNQPVTLYSHSYLGAGIIAARKAILNQHTRPTPKALKNGELYTACMPPDLAIKWNGTGGGGVSFLVRGTKQYSAHVCEQQVRKYAREILQPHAPVELKERELFGFSYFYDRALQLAKKMRGIEVSWALGGAYHLLNNYHQKQMKNVENNKVSAGKIGNDRKSNTSWAIYLMEKAYVKVRWVAETFRLL